MGELPIKPKPPLTHTRINSQGFLEIIDLHTGNILCVQRQPGDDFLQAKFDNLMQIETPQGMVWIDRSIDPGRVFLANSVKYSLSWGYLLAEHLVNGSSLSRACASLQLPYGLVCRWKSEFPEFRAILDDAKRDRAESFHDEIIDTARATTHITEKPDKIKIDALKWAAEKGDPDKFGQRTKLVGDPTQPISFLIDTGIRRRGDGGYTPQPSPEGFPDLNEQGSSQSPSQSDVIDVTPPPEDFNDQNKQTLAAAPLASGHALEPLDENVSSAYEQSLWDMPEANSNNGRGKR